MNLKHSKALLMIILSSFSLGCLYAQPSSEQQSTSTIVLNPNGKTPLSAVYRLEKPNTEIVAITIKGKKSDLSVYYEFPSGFGKEFPLHGLYANHENTVVIQHGDNPERVFRIRTQPIQFVSHQNTPLNLTAKIKTDILETPCISNQDFYFSSIPNDRLIIAYDRKGDIRYVYQDTGKPYVIRMENDEKKIFFLMIDDNKFYQKMDLLGNIVFRHKMNVHHESVPYGSKYELILANSRWGWEDSVWAIDLNPPRDPKTPKKKPKPKIITKYLIGDAIRKVVAPKDMELLNQVIYDDNNIYQIIRKNVTNAKPKPTKIDWAHANSLIYNHTLDRLYVSLRHQGVLAIKLSTWTLEWFIADDELKIKSGFKYGEKPAETKYLKDIPSLKKYRLTTTSFNGAPKGQHTLLLRKNGDLLMFDNQADDPKNPTGSRIISYRIDENNKVARVMDQFATIDRSYSRLVSDVDITGVFHENKLILYGHGTPRRMVEIGINNNILFDLQINTPAIFYRVDKYPMYPYSEFGKKYTVDYNESAD